MNESPGLASESGVMRAFVAVELPDEIKRSLSDLQIHLRRTIHASAGAKNADRILKWVNPQGIHLTLKFLGNVPIQQIGDVETALRKAVGHERSCVLQLVGTGVFPSWTRPRVIWVGLFGQTEEMRQLQRQVENALHGLGFPPEARPFNPHITLARIREEASAGEKRSIGEAIKSAVDTEKWFGELRVEEISLMRSELMRAGPRYSRLAVVRLAG